VKVLGSASELYKEAGQYELALNFVDQQLEQIPEGDAACIARYVRIASLYKSNQLQGIQSQFDQGVASCQKADDTLYANGIYFIVASLEVEQNNFDGAIALLKKNHADVQKLSYPPLISQFDALLADAYWKKNDPVRATPYALAAVAVMGKNDVAESLATAYKVLYLASRKSGDMTKALTYHEKYMAADKGYLNEVSARSMAFQVVSQQVLAKKLQVDALSKQNQILELQHSLGAKAAETSRLYIILLLTILASIAYWAYRLKRSQMSFMKLARRDGLTGIYNRQHFVTSAERQLQYCEKSGRVAGLIVIDLDHFKIVNDTHGHAVGDHILKRAVAACEAHLRSTDVFGRLGGEEFGILMPECDKHIAAGRADLIRMAIASVSDSEETAGVAVSASFGVSSTTQSGYNLRQLLIHADKALYAAKRGGRNRVELFTDSGMGVKASFEDLPLDPR
jgi:diguanylate cyclase (GGDEF)-like protein